MTDAIIVKMITVLITSHLFQLAREAALSSAVKEAKVSPFSFASVGALVKKLTTIITTIEKVNKSGAKYRK